MSSGRPGRDGDMPTVAAVAFPDGRTGFFGIRDTSSVRAAVVAFAMTKMGERSEPVPVVATPSVPHVDSAEPALPVVEDVVGSIRVVDLRELADDAVDDLITDYLGPVPPTTLDVLPVDEALEHVGDHEIALVVNERHEVTGVVSRTALVAAVAGDDQSFAGQSVASESVEGEPVASESVAGESSAEGWSNRGA